MSMFENLARTMMIEKPAKKFNYKKFHKRFTKRGEKVLRRMRESEDTPFNRQKIRHIAGMEAWGQRRLRTMLGEPLEELDEMDGYRPSIELEWDELIEAYEDTHNTSLDIIERLADADVDIQATVPHNQFGDLTVGGWLFYLDMHSNFEVRTMSKPKEEKAKKPFVGLVIIIAFLAVGYIVYQKTKNKPTAS